MDWNKLVKDARQDFPGKGKPDAGLCKCQNSERNETNPQLCKHCGKPIDLFGDTWIINILNGDE